MLAKVTAAVRDTVASEPRAVCILGHRIPKFTAGCLGDVIVEWYPVCKTCDERVTLMSIVGKLEGGS